jgi:BRCA1-associated protein
MAADSFDKNGAACLEEKSTKAEADTVVLRIAIQEEKDDLPDWTHVIRFNDLNANREGVMADENLTQASLGQRHVHELHLERYISQASSATSDDIPLKELPDNIPYFSGIPSVEVTEGIIHLFRDKSKKLDDRISSILCVLGVPAHMSLSDFLNFISPSLSSIESIQVVRDSVPNQYMILLRFKDKAAARLFYSLYNMKRYNSLEKRVCQLVYASRIEVLKTSQCIAIPNEGLVELPSCPVCLDRLDESILTILCNHSFHTECLTKWEDSTCPVCRYTQIPEPTSDNTCMTCDSKEDLWICLICGNVGCGRYHGGHAHEQALINL